MDRFVGDPEDTSSVPVTVDDMWDLFDVHCKVKAGQQAEQSEVDARTETGVHQVAVDAGWQLRVV